MLRIQIESLVAGIDGAETIISSENATVGNLIAGFVFERRMRPETVADLSLQDAKGNILKHHRTVGSYDLKDGDKLYLAKNEAQVLLGCRNWFAIAVIAFVTSLVGFGVLIYMYTKTGSYPFDYVVVIDAGSTHTDLSVYNWSGKKYRGTGVVEEVSSLRCEARGLQNYDTAREAAKSLSACITSATDLVPLDRLSATEIYLGATAGMRLLEIENATAARAIMDAVRMEIHGNYGFKYSDNNVRTITGEEEGAYGWMTTNFLAKTLPSEHKPFSYGALDLGGASTQISFAPTNSSNITTVLNLFSEQYSVYSHSYLCYGLREAERRLKASLIVSAESNATTIENPCQPRGNSTTEHSSSIFAHYCTEDFVPSIPSEIYYFTGTSNSTGCRAIVQNLFNTTFCPYPSCFFDGVPAPALNGTFMAFAGYYSTMEFLNLTDGTSAVSLGVFRNATEIFCNKTWNEISYLNASDPHSPFLTMYCFDANFVDSLLTVGYGFTDKNFQDIHFMKNISGISVGWSLGLALNSTNVHPSEHMIPSVTVPVFALLMVIFSVLLILAFVFFARAYGVIRRYRNYEPLSTYGAI